MPKSERAVATFTIHGAARMTPAGRKFIATWLRDQATNLLRDGDKYSERFTARYINRRLHR